jgi:phosphatidylglycerophosphate synthase
VPTIRTGPLVGLAGQVVLLALLARTVGLGGAGWLAGMAYGLVLCATLSRGLHTSGAAELLDRVDHHDHPRALAAMHRPVPAADQPHVPAADYPRVLAAGRRLGPADRVTLVRATIVGAVTALAADSVARPAPVVLMVALASVALVLDAVDGQVARRTGTASALGARFDMEVDAFLILVLSGYAARAVGGWVLAIGAMRYAYVAASWVLPWLRGSLPPSYWRKAVAATQGIVLVFAVAGVLPRPLTAAALAVSLALLVASFGSCVGLLRPHRPAIMILRDTPPWPQPATEPPRAGPGPAFAAGRVQLAMPRRCLLTACAAPVSSGISRTVTPAPRSRSTPWQSATNRGGSRQAITTCRTPAARMRAAQGCGRERRSVQGSRVL